MSLTLNQIVARIKAIAEAHEQINTFVFGDLDEVLRNDIIYPACFMPYPREQGNGSDLNMSASLFFMDRQIQGGGVEDNTFNELEVTSDMREVAKDIYAQLRYQQFDPRWNVSTQFAINPSNEQQPDYLAGVQLEFTIKLPYTTDRCVVPTTYNYGN
jgi:hypothetical protein